MTADETATPGKLQARFSGAESAENVFTFLAQPPAAAPATTTAVAVRTEAPLSAPKDEPAGPEPAEDAPVAQRVAYYEGVVDRERERFKDTVAAADRRFLERASKPLYALSKGLYREVKSDRTGKPFTRFEDYLAERWSISRSHAYRILNEYPVLKALGDAAPDKLSTRQVPKLHRVLRAHGEEAVRKAWDGAEEKSPAGLQESIDRLGLGSTADILDLSDSNSARPVPPLAATWEKAVKGLDPAKVSALEPASATSLLARLRPLVEALEARAALPAGKKDRKK